jgi:hypothetical protein
MVEKRGGSPTLPVRRRNNNLNHNDNSPNRVAVSPTLTVGGAIHHARDGLRAQPQKDLNDAYRDVVATFRERERINALPSYSSNGPRNIRLNEQRRRQIESEVLGTNNVQQQAVPATALVKDTNATVQLAQHQDMMAPMGDIGAYEIEQQPPPGPPPPGPPPPGPPPPGPPPPGPSHLPSTWSSEEEEARAEIFAMRQQLKMLKEQNRRLANESTTPTKEKEEEFSTFTSPSDALTAKIAEIKERAQRDLEDLWTNDTIRAKNLPLPLSKMSEVESVLDHGVNNNRNKNNTKAAPISTDGISTPASKLEYQPSISEMLRRTSTKFDGDQKLKASDFQ